MLATLQKNSTNRMVVNYTNEQSGEVSQHGVLVEAIIDGSFVEFQYIGTDKNVYKRPVQEFCSMIVSGNSRSSEEDDAAPANVDKTRKTITKERTKQQNASVSSKESTKRSHASMSSKESPAEQPSCPARRTSRETSRTRSGPTYTRWQVYSNTRIYIDTVGKWRADRLAHEVDCYVSEMELAVMDEEVKKAVRTEYKNKNQSKKSRTH